MAAGNPLRPLSGHEESPDTVTSVEHREDNGEIDLSFLQPPTAPGSLGRLGHYDVREVLGRGGCGIVLKAFDEKLQRLVAIKVLSPSTQIVTVVGSLEAMPSKARYEKVTEPVKLAGGL